MFFTLKRPVTLSYNGSYLDFELKTYSATTSKATSTVTSL